MLPPIIIVQQKKTRKWGKFTLLDEEREMRKIQSLEKQEKKTLAKQNMLEMVELKQKMDLRMELEKRHIQRVKDQLQKNSNVELKKLKLLKKKQMVGLPVGNGSAKHCGRAQATLPPYTYAPRGCTKTNKHKKILVNSLVWGSLCSPSY